MTLEKEIEVSWSQEATHAMAGLAPSRYEDYVTDDSGYTERKVRKPVFERRANQIVTVYKYGVWE